MIHGSYPIEDESESGEDVEIWEEVAFFTWGEQSRDKLATRGEAGFATGGGTGDGELLANF